jgi:hypothetical protein
MRKIRDMLRSNFEGGLSERVIAHSLSLSNGSVTPISSALQRRDCAGLCLDDGALEFLLFPPASARAAQARPMRVEQPPQCGARQDQRRRWPRASPVDWLKSVLLADVGLIAKRNWTSGGGSVQLGVQ